MKLLVLFLSLLILASNGADVFQKFTKVTCSSSGKLCPKVYCRVKAVSRNVSVLNFSCNLTKTLNYFDFTFRSYHKNFEGGNYRQIIDLSNMNACLILGSIDKFENLKKAVEYMTLSYNGLVHSCPYDKFNVINGSVIPVEKMKKMEKKGFGPFPTGYYKVQLKASNKEDNKIWEMFAYIEYRSPQDLNDKF